MIDTHCHIQDTDYDIDFDQELENSVKAGVNNLILIGCTAGNSRQAAKRAIENDNCYAIIGIHPHEADGYSDAAAELEGIFNTFGDPIGFRTGGNFDISPRGPQRSVPKALDSRTAEENVKSAPEAAPDSAGFATETARVLRNPIIGVGEIGTDYWYLNSKKESQRRVLAEQMQFANSKNLPLNFHIRGSREDPHDAFKDAWDIIDNAGQNAGGVVHSFTGDTELMNQCLDRGFYLGFNGILTFTKDEKQIEMLRAAPTERIVLETDAPFLAPKGKRGEQNTPANIPVIAELLAEARGEDVEEFIAVTTANAKRIYKI